MNARLCLDCEELHDQQHCPVCGSESFAFLTRWVTPSEALAAESSTPRTTAPPAPARQPNGGERREQLERREQVDAYRQILNPAPPARRGRLVARGALGLALFGLARMIWRAAPDHKTESGTAPGPRLSKDAQ